MKKTSLFLLVTFTFILLGFHSNCLGDDKEIVVMTWGGNFGDSFKKTIAEPFEKKFGIRVVMELQTTVRAAIPKLQAQKENPQIDVWTASMGGVEAAGQLGLLVPINEEMIPNIKEIYDYGRGPYSVGWYTTPRGILYRSDLVSFEIHEWKDLWDARLKNKLATPDISFAGGQFLVICALVGGGNEHNIEPGFEMAKKLKPNIAMFFSSDSDAIKLLQAGEAGVTAMSLLPNVYPLLGKDERYKFPVPTTPLLGSTDQITITNPKKKELAAKLVNYMLSAEVQEALCFELGAVPINKKGKAPKEVAYIIPNLQKLYNADFDYINKNLAAWTDRWNREIKTR
jgi:putative spermidine/putrescine transport system substrate-binding protein